MRWIDVFIVYVVILSLASAVCVTVPVTDKTQVIAYVSMPGGVTAETDNEILDFQMRLYKPNNAGIEVYDDGFDYNDVYDMEKGYFDKPGKWRVWIVPVSAYRRGNVKICSNVVSSFDVVQEEPRGFIERLLSWIRGIFGI